MWDRCSTTQPTVPPIGARAELRKNFEAQFIERSEHPDDALRTALQLGDDIEHFWSEVQENLEQGKLRLVFVADQIPMELQRIIEFLNQQMTKTEVIGVEVKQYVGEGHQTLVPRVIGQTALAIDTKRTRLARQWDEPSLLQDLAEKKGPELAHAGKKLLDWARARGLRVIFGRGAEDGSFKSVLEIGEWQYWPFYLYSNGSIHIPVGDLRQRPPFDDPAFIEELSMKFETLHGVRIPRDRAYPTIEIDSLADDAALRDFVEICEWILEQAKDAAKG